MSNLENRNELLLNNIKEVKLYKIGKYLFEKEEDALLYAQYVIQFKQNLYDHGLGYYVIEDSEENFINEMHNIASNIEYDEDTYDSLYDAYYNDDPMLSDEDRTEIQSWIDDFVEMRDDVYKAIKSRIPYVPKAEINSKSSWGYSELKNVIGSLDQLERITAALYGNGGYVDSDPDIYPTGTIYNIHPVNVKGKKGIFYEQWK